MEYGSCADCGQVLAHDAFGEHECVKTWTPVRVEFVRAGRVLQSVLVTTYYQSPRDLLTQLQFRAARDHGSGTKVRLRPNRRDG